jgi:menaquinone-9 beta-reductase
MPPQTGTSPFPGLFSEDRVFDTAVIGAGPAGSTVATRLARGGLTVLLCDAARFPRHKICGEYVPPAAIRSFSALGVLAEVQALGPRRLAGMTVISPDGTEVAGTYGDPSLRGFSLRRFDLDRVLVRNAHKSGATLAEGWRLGDLRRGRDGLHDLLLVADEPARRGVERRRVRVRARSIVGADGRNSLVARRLGLWRRDPTHRKWALMAYVRDVETPEDRGEMIITPYGYCGLNPLPDGLANVCLVIDRHGRAGALPGAPGLAAFFRDHLEAHRLTRRRMARARIAGGPWAIGPMACRATSGVAEGALLVGDAAGFFDPFTGEGIAMALRGGEMAAAVLLEAFARGDLTRRALEPYERGRRSAFGARLRLDRMLQAIVSRPRLADWVARKLRRDQRLADLVARVAGDVADAAEVLHPRFLARLLRA